MDTRATGSVISKPAQKFMGRVQWPHVMGNSIGLTRPQNNEKQRTPETNKFPMQ
jgi:hypothetical protein